MSEKDPLQCVADKYRQQGYDVVLHPSVSELPTFLSETPVEILARKGDHLVALQVNTQVKGREEPVRVAAELGVHYAVSLLEEAEMLLSPRTMRAALVMSWAAFEAAARLALQPERTAFAGATVRQLTGELRERGFLNPEEYAKLSQAVLARSAVAHGVWTEELSPELVSFVLGLTRRLLPAAASVAGFRAGFASACSVAVLRAPLKKIPKLHERVNRATEVLMGLLGRSRGSVTIDWDVAEDARGNPVLVLKLSDLTGIVTATFDQWELEDEEHLVSRLNHLWGDLLEIRSHKQLQNVLHPTGR